MPWEIEPLEYEGGDEPQPTKDFEADDLPDSEELEKLQDEVSALNTLLCETHLHRENLKLSDYYSDPTGSTACLIADTPEHRALLSVVQEMIQNARRILESIESSKED